MPYPHIFEVKRAADDPVIVGEESVNVVPVNWLNLLLLKAGRRGIGELLKHYIGVLLQTPNYKGKMGGSIY